MNVSSQDVIDIDECRWEALHIATLLFGGLTKAGFHSKNEKEYVQDVAAGAAVFLASPHTNSTFEERKKALRLAADRLCEKYMFYRFGTEEDKKRVMPLLKNRNLGVEALVKYALQTLEVFQDLKTVIDEMNKPQPKSKASIK